jgi:adenylate cyclase
MVKKFDYTTKARTVVHRFPRFSYISIQVNFWVFAFIFLFTLFHIYGLALSASNIIQIPLKYIPVLLIALIIGIIYGTILGLTDLFLEGRKLQQRALGSIILIRMLIYLLLLIVMIFFIRYILWYRVITPHFFEETFPAISTISWKFYFIILVLYTAVMSVAISFINLMNKKFGPGVIIPMMLGRYRNPREEERIFMFMDLKDSTSHAEKLGHLKYSAMIRDSFMDINQVLAKHNAEIYQYVGDEIVVNWPLGEGIRNLACVEFFFSVQDQFSRRHDFYMENYGFVPQFKAGLHLGIVTAVEVGEIKRDIAYHGDTLNTASRIQGICNQYNKSLLISSDIRTIADLDKNYNLESLGQITLKGKGTPVEVYSIDSKK